MTIVAVGAADLAQVVVVALVAGLGVTTVFSLALLGAIHARDARRDGRRVHGLAWSGLSLAALVGVAAAVLAGLWVIAS